ncbi:alanine racemase [Rhizomonospora bruguierae]|uniref:alanine racemase n=1 Tax=Rhizomonospora bruguierae TaxID=1581705 RepID=UPI001BD154BE|nr:alanine racemase [Micromonospora sp. NBRC 107566]
MRPEPIPERVAAALRELPSPACAYVYDTAALRATAAALRAALPAGTTLLYAVKANGHPAVVRTLAAATDGLEVASGGELALAVAAGARRVAIGGPAKTDRDLAAAVAAGATIHVESRHELRRLAVVAGGRAATIALRVNRRGAGPAGSHRMTGTPTPFGIDEDGLPDAAALARSLPGLDLVGFHLHAVSNNLDAAAHAAFIEDALDWSLGAAARAGFPLRYVNAGGGFGVDYTGAAAFDPAALSGIAVPDGVELAVEPGRYLAAAAGWYAAEVLDLKRTHGRWFAVLRGGTHHFRLPAAWGYSHPFTVLPVDRWPYPFPRPEIRDTTVDAVGELCTPRDVLARDHPVARLRAGDLLVFPRTGAYGWDISHREFLRHPYPEMVVL